MNRSYVKPPNKILRVLVLGGGPIGLFIGYKLLKKGNDVTIFEKRLHYTRHNILSLQETNKIDTLSIIPSEIMSELEISSSFANLNHSINGKCRHKNILKNKPYLMVSSRIYYIVLSELEMAYEKSFIKEGGTLIKPVNSESFDSISYSEEHKTIKYKDLNTLSTINTFDYDIIFIADGANSFYRNIFFKSTSYIDHIEQNIVRYGLNESNTNLKLSFDPIEISPLAYGMIFLFDIPDKEDFQKKFHTQEKLETKNDYNSFYRLDDLENLDFFNGINIKEILLQNPISSHPQEIKSQNFFRMFVSENYLYISLMVNPSDIKSYNSTQVLTFSTLQPSLQIYIKFALYYYDLSELIDPTSENCHIKLFPLTFTSVKQSCTFMKKYPDKKPSMVNWKQTNTSYINLKKQIDDNHQCTCEEEPINNNNNNNDSDQLIFLCGDAMASGNFHAGIVLNRNLIAANHICSMIDEYIDAYPKTSSGKLNNNFLRLMFFNANVSNQVAINDIISKSIDATINFGEIDKDEFTFTLQDALKELDDIILCKNCSKENKLMCDNSVAFVKFLVENAENETLNRILKYLFLPDKYKYKLNTKYKFPL